MFGAKRRCPPGRSATLALSLAGFLLLGAVSARAENGAHADVAGPSGKRIALIVGNSDYQAKGLALKNPRNDAHAIEGALSKVSPKFKIILVEDLRAEKIEEVLKQFEMELQGSDVGLFYFAGHAFQYDGENYLLPVDIPWDPDTRKRLHEQLKQSDAGKLPAIRLNDVLRRMERLARVKLIFLDACRDNPFSVSQVVQVASSGSGNAASTRSAGPAPGVPSIGKGLAAISGFAGGSLIAYATSPGAVAKDGADANSPFTSALAHNIAIQGVDIQEVMLNVNAEVQEKTTDPNGEVQIPWVNHSFVKKFYLWPWTAEQELRNIARAEQAQLKRLGCFSSEPDGEWSTASKRSIAAFNNENRTGLTIDPSIPSEEVVRRLISLDGKICQKAPVDLTIKAPVTPRRPREAVAPQSHRNGGGRSETLSPTVGGGIGGF